MIVPDTPPTTGSLLDTDLLRVLLIVLLAGSLLWPLGTMQSADDDAAGQSGAPTVQIGTRGDTGAFGAVRGSNDGPPPPAFVIREPAGAHAGG